MSSLGKKRAVFILLGLLVYIADQASKYPFRSSWQLGESLRLNPFLELTYVHNTGSLFGMFQGNAFVLGLISLIVTIGIIIYALRLPATRSWLQFITLGFLVGGAAGNGYDRLVHGFVVDFFSLRWYGKPIFAVFNVADIAVDVAIALFILIAFIEPDPQTEAKKLNQDDPYNEVDRDKQAFHGGAAKQALAEQETDSPSL